MTPEMRKQLEDEFPSALAELDRLRAALAESQAEEQAVRLRNVERIDEYKAKLTAAEQRLESAEKLLDGLGGHTRHSKHCNDHLSEGPCTCGLQTIRNEIADYFREKEKA